MVQFMKRDETPIKLVDGSIFPRYQLWCEVCLFHHHPDKDCVDLSGWIDGAKPQNVEKANLGDCFFIEGVIGNREGFDFKECPYEHGTDGECGWKMGWKFSDKLEKAVEELEKKGI